MPADWNDEEREFVREFTDRVIALVQNLRQEFPSYRQIIRWTIEWENEKKHTIHMIIKPRI